MAALSNESDGAIKEIVNGMASFSITDNDFRAYRIFDFFDKDKDGLMKYEDLNELQTLTAGEPLTKPQWKVIYRKYIDKIIQIYHLHEIMLFFFLPHLSPSLFSRVSFSFISIYHIYFLRLFVELLALILKRAAWICLIF